MTSTDAGALRTGTRNSRCFLVFALARTVRDRHTNMTLPMLACSCGSQDQLASPCRRFCFNFLSISPLVALFVAIKRTSNYEMPQAAAAAAAAAAPYHCRGVSRRAAVAEGTETERELSDEVFSRHNAGLANFQSYACGRLIESSAGCPSRQRSIFGRLQFPIFFRRPISPRRMTGVA